MNQSRLYTDSHEWIILNERKSGTIGITAYAQKELGEVVYIELPNIGQIVSAGDEVAVLESTKAATDVYAPISGRIIAVNEQLKKNPSLLNEDPEEKGWLIKMELSFPEEIESLLREEEYFELTS